MAIIAVNPGHYPALDSGAVGPAGLREADVAMAVAQQLSQRLTGIGHLVSFISANELESIAAQANAAAADGFVSIHCNGAVRSAARGTETWAYAGSIESKRLAERIQAELVIELGLVNRGVKLSNGLYVLRHTAMPAVLVELAFITNPEEEMLLGSVSTQESAAAAIARAVDKWLCT